MWNRSTNDVAPALVAGVYASGREVATMRQGPSNERRRLASERPQANAAGAPSGSGVTVLRRDDEVSVEE
jgi:hypothetical protein